MPVVSMYRDIQKHSIKIRFFLLKEILHKKWIALWGTEHMEKAQCDITVDSTSVR